MGSFKPGDYVVAKDPLGNRDISIVKSVNFERGRDRMVYDRHRWGVTMMKYAWRFDHFTKTTISKIVDSFVGSKRIIDLDLYPLAHDKNRSLTMADAIERGKQWKMYHERDATTMSYKGLALPLIAEGSVNQMSDFQKQTKVLNVRLYCTLP
jgi:hypothetical protein